MSEIIAPSGRSITDVAADLGVSQQALSTVLNGHASLSAAMALRFERHFKISADTLMRNAVIIRSCASTFAVGGLKGLI